jgi:hypothetical protein
LPDHPPQAVPEAPIQVPSPVPTASPAPLPPPDLNIDLPQEANKNKNEENGVPAHGNVTRTRSGRQVRPPQRMHLKSSKKHFGMDSLPVYTGRIETQVPLSKVIAIILTAW